LNTELALLYLLIMRHTHTYRRTRSLRNSTCRRRQ